MFDILHLENICFSYNIQKPYIRFCKIYKRGSSLDRLVLLTKHNSRTLVLRCKSAKKIGRGHREWAYAILNYEINQKCSYNDEIYNYLSNFEWNNIAAPISLKKNIVLYDKNIHNITLNNTINLINDELSYILHGVISMLIFKHLHAFAMWFTAPRTCSREDRTSSLCDCPRLTVRR